MLSRREARPLAGGRQITLDAWVLIHQDRVERKVNCELEDADHTSAAASRYGEENECVGKSSLPGPVSKLPRLTDSKEAELPEGESGEFDEGPGILHNIRCKRRRSWSPTRGHSSGAEVNEPDLKKLRHFHCKHLDPNHTIEDRWLSTHKFKCENKIFPTLNIKLALDPSQPKNYEQFVESMVNTYEGEPHNGNHIPSGKNRHLQIPLSVRLEAEIPEAAVTPVKVVKHVFQNIQYTFSGKLTLLDDTGNLSYPGPSDLTNVVFTPSKGRCETGFFRWQSHRAIGVLLVPEDEQTVYTKCWGRHFLVISTPHHTIGGARHHILTLARHWRLNSFWQVDDSVPWSEFYESGDPISKRRSASHVMAWLGDFAVRRGIALAGVESVVASNNRKEQRRRSCPSEDRHNTTQWQRLKNYINTRAPASFVFVNLEQIPPELTYDERLPCKEDAVFAARLIMLGKGVCVSQKFHFNDC